MRANREQHFQLPGGKSKPKRNRFEHMRARFLKRFSPLDFVENVLPVAKLAFSMPQNGSQGFC